VSHLFSPAIFSRALTSAFAAAGRQDAIGLARERDERDQIAAKNVASMLAPQFATMAGAPTPGTANMGLPPINPLQAAIMGAEAINLQQQADPVQELLSSIPVQQQIGMLQQLRLTQQSEEEQRVNAKMLEIRERADAAATAKIAEIMLENPTVGRHMMAQYQAGRAGVSIGGGAGSGGSGTYRLGDIDNANFLDDTSLRAEQGAIASAFGVPSTQALGEWAQAPDELVRIPDANDPRGYVAMDYATYMRRREASLARINRRNSFANPNAAHLFNEQGVGGQGDTIERAPQADAANPVDGPRFTVFEQQSAAAEAAHALIGRGVDITTPEGREQLDQLANRILQQRKR
jgi:hypothetical protein